MIQYQSGYKHQLYAAYTHPLPPEIAGAVKFEGRFLSLVGGNLIIAAGYAWDGPSGPAFDTKTFMRASLVHDALYQLMREHILLRALKDAVDDEMRRICIEDGMSAARAWWCHRGVKKFGMMATIRNRDILVAP